ncbi:hypothetical protein Vafri_6877 [Volvox africanus]|uniref:Uncharacterized protein n=1 Tax=Volvox africanus TaxID=51714 RepID=A0A8J4EWE4_9CHLO|nr:hypothetical protein Vafri_6877 [Volvox africanus]
MHASFSRESIGGGPSALTTAVGTTTGNGKPPPNPANPSGGGGGGGRERGSRREEGGTKGSEPLLPSAGSAVSQRRLRGCSGGVETATTPPPVDKLSGLLRPSISAAAWYASAFAGSLEADAFEALCWRYEPATVVPPVVVTAPNATPAAGGRVVVVGDDGTPAVGSMGAVWGRNRTYMLLLEPVLPTTWTSSMLGRPSACAAWSTCTGPTCKPRGRVHRCRLM